MSRFPSPRSRVTLVGAGPGDPELLTLRALRALQEADHVLYDRLVPAAILALIPAGIPREFAGKVPGRRGEEQTAINTRLIELARQHSRVVRLKGGDPFIFGRGGEEALALEAAGIDYEIVPGVTAALGCGAAAGIPLTHRGLAQQVTLITAHRADEAGAIDWPALARTGHTIVFYMGVGEVETIEHQLCLHGRDPTTPVALVENGCLPEQRVFRGRLAGMATLARQVALKAPALLIVGEVAGLELSPLGLGFDPRVLAA